MTQDDIMEDWQEMLSNVITNPPRDKVEIKDENALAIRSTLFKVGELEITDIYRTAKMVRGAGLLCSHRYPEYHWGIAEHEGQWLVIRVAPK